MANAFDLVEVGDERAHQARLSHAGCQREAERWEVTLEVRNVRELGVNSGERLRYILVFAQWKQVTYAVEDLQRFALRGAQTQTVGNCVSSRFHSAAPCSSVEKR